MAPATILFVSDSRNELEAAQAAGMDTRFSLRPENPAVDPGPFEAITSLEQIEL